jgi:hypothetical protein
VDQDKTKVRQGERNPIAAALVLIVLMWCVGVLYMIASVSVFGAKDPLGSGDLALLAYELIFLDPTSHSGKLDLPIALVHAFVLYKSCQWLWRHRRPDALTSQGRK